MAHRVLALKYRPQVFSDLVGQEHVSQVLARAIEGGRIAHAYLFAGARGVGKTTSARILAKALNCQNRQGAEPCNQCSSCTEITTGVSLDVAEIDGASNRGIADVQALREKVRFSPTGGRYRVVIIDEVHQLSNDAFAALLKTLEEPPAHLVFIFATTDPQKLPETIRSRTQRFDFARVPVRKVAARLAEIAAREAADPQGVHFDLGEGAALLIAQKGEGSIRDAVSALDQVVSSGEARIDEELVRRILGIPDREAFFALVEAIVRRDPRAALAALHAAFQKGIDPAELAQGLTEHLRHLLVLKVDPEAAELVPATSEELVRLKAQAAEWSEHDLLRLMRLGADLGWPMRDSAQPLIHLEAAVLQMATLEPGETLAQLLARLEALEQRLAAVAPGQAVGTGGARAGAAGSSEEASRRALRGERSPGGYPPERVRSEPGLSEPKREAQAGGARSTTPLPGSQAPPRSVVAGPLSGPRAPIATSVTEPAPGATTTTVADDEETPLLDATILERWERVMEAVNARKRMLGAFLQESRLLGVTREAIVIAMDDLHRSVVDERTNRELVESEAAVAFGRRLVLRCAVPGPDDGARVRKAAEVRPLVEQAIRWFDGDPVQPGREAPRRDG